LLWTHRGRVDLFGRAAQLGGGWTHNSTLFFAAQVNLEFDEFPHNDFTFSALFLR
jgi:hypothetical protein